MSPAKTTVPPSASRTIDAAAYGFVPAADVNPDYAGPNADRDPLLHYVATGDWAAIENLMRSMERRSERRFEALWILGKAAVVEDAWLDAWLAAVPDSVDAICAQMNSMVKVAWEIRTGQQPQHVSRDRWDGFFRLLRQVPSLRERAVALAPDDPAPHIEMLTAAMGLQWSNDDFRALWSDVVARVPHSVAAAVRALAYWRPRWFGSLELIQSFVDTVEADAPLGAMLSQLRLEMLYTELRPDAAPARTEFDRSDDVRSAIEAGLADAEAADPSNVRLPFLRHWLAFWLHLSGRDYEAIEQFRAIGGYSGAAPWTYWTNAKAEFTATRATAVARWEDGGRVTG